MTIPHESTITIVTGLPRSGTSMMMRMLEVGGMPVLTDNIRTADEDNPRGYYEYEPVKQTARDPSWLGNAGGKAIKMVYRLLFDLPADCHYHAIFMRRNTDEVLASQKRMLARHDRQTTVSDLEMAKLFRAELTRTLAWLEGQANFSHIEIDYNSLLSSPSRQLASLDSFLGGKLNVQAMRDVIDQRLYRQRAA